MTSTETAAKFDEPMNTGEDYRRIAGAIDYIRRERDRQPTLQDLAAHIHLSPAHVQRVFARWAGISPKRFLQLLTVEHIKQRLNTPADLLDLADEAGLSGPGRLHDLFIAMEALSPGEFRQAARGIVIRYGSGETPFGQAVIAHTDRGICRLAFVADQTAAEVAELRAMFPQSELIEDHVAAQSLLDRVFASGLKGARRGLSLWIAGSNFQVQVWRALMRLPFGDIASYSDIADALGRPRAARSVGTAIGANPIAFLIPCHRVLRADGDIGSYHWGATRKAAMVTWEAARRATE